MKCPRLIRLHQTCSRVVCADFNVKYEGESKMIVEGDAFIKSVVTKTLEGQGSQSHPGRPGKKRNRTNLLYGAGMSIQALCRAYIEGEHPQTIAMILAHMPAEISSEIMMNLPDELKGDISMRIARLGQISEDVVRDVDKALEYELSGAVGPGGKAGGLGSPGGYHQWCG